VKVLVDSCIWSLALACKKKQESVYIDEFKKLINEVRVQTIGVISQEILSEIKLPEHFALLKENLSGFNDLALSKIDYELASE